MFLAAGVHLGSNIIMAIVRRLTQPSNNIQPELSDPVVWLWQIGVSAIQVILIAFIFIKAHDKLRKELSFVEESDRLKMAVLQQETMGSKIPALTGADIGKLLELWGVILIAVRMVYDICSMVYQSQDNGPSQETDWHN